MADTEPTTPQEGGPQGAAEPGAVEPQVAEPIVETPPGAVTEAPKPERTYTQREVSALEAAKDKEIAQHRQMLAQLAMQREIDRVQAQEAQAQAMDFRAVESGDITQEQAAQRVQQRQQAYRQQIAWQQEQTNFHQAQAATNEGLRILAAQEMAKEHGVDVKELLTDKTLTDADRMEAKAVRLALERTRAELKAAQGGGEFFDSGQVGSVGVSIDKMTPEQKVAWGLTHPPRRKT